MLTQDELDKSASSITCSGDWVGKPDLTLGQEEGDGLETKLSVDHWARSGGTKTQDTLAQGYLHLLQLGLKGSWEKEGL